MTTSPLVVFNVTGGTLVATIGAGAVTGAAIASASAKVIAFRSNTGEAAAGIISSSETTSSFSSGLAAVGINPLSSFAYSSIACFEKSFLIFPLAMLIICG